MISHPIEQTRAETAGLCRETVLEWKYLLDTDNMNERKGSRDRLKLQMVDPCQTYCEHPSICVISSSFPRMCTIRKILIMSEPSPNILACHLACPSYYWSLTNIEMQRPTVKLLTKVFRKINIKCIFATTLTLSFFF